ncbi:MAG: ATP-dependent DNA helicase RecG [bacterium]|nr:ATP-dependent DNA helicase RecG [bacterium]
MSHCTEPTADLLQKLLDFMRKEYRDHCRGRLPMEKTLDRLEELLESAPMAEAREILRIVRPLRSYSLLPAGERLHRLTEAGRELRRFLPNQDGQAQETVCPLPSAQRREMDVRIDLSQVKAIPQKRPYNYLSCLNDMGLRTLADLLTFFPRRWEDRRQQTAIERLADGAVESICGTLGDWSVKPTSKNMVVLENTITDATGSITAVWFNQKFLPSKFRSGQKVIAIGKIERTLFHSKITSPEMESQLGPFINTNRIVPVYPLSGRMTQTYMRGLQFKLVPTYAGMLLNPLPPSLEQKHQLMERSRAVLEMHWPSTYDNRDAAQRRLAYEELLLLQLQICQRRQAIITQERRNFYNNCEQLKAEFQQILPYALTGAQQRVCREITSDLTSKYPMNRLVQGDVGSGKTVVAAFAAFLAIKNGYQVALMAPTEILATQHYQKLSALLAPAGISVGNLQGSLTKKKKLQTYEKLASHEIDLIVGTHALIQEGVNFKRLGLVIVDEQHKFGVMQRTILRQKGEHPDLLVMTATPIPRTLSLTLYGDLDSSRIDELPPGRKPIKSQYVAFSERDKVLEMIRYQINQGRQAYIVCPLIDENDKIEAAAAIQECDYLRQRVYPEFAVGLLHGKMKSAEKDEVMSKFKDGDYKILISTTVIEVGVDVPNATVMLVENADRFGLAQLHQLRGRIGRGEHQSMCLFMGQPKGSLAKRKLKAIARISDGFEVAEEDLDIRGPGDYYGMRQSGLPELKVADLMRDGQLLTLARQDVLEILRIDPELEQPDHQALKQHLHDLQFDVSEIIH